MLDYRPVPGEIEIRAVLTIVADKTALIFRRRFIIPCPRFSDVSRAGAVARFTLHVGELRSRPDIDETLFLITERMASDAGRIIHPLPCFERRKCFRVQ